MTKPQGIEVNVLPAAVPEDSARMDVAGFVGFAAAGPLDTPVVIHSASHFREVFGEDQPLAWNPADGQMEYAHLGAAVRSFFRNGGQRCWVVRVADRPTTNHFPVKGLWQVRAEKQWQEEAGSWLSGKVSPPLAHLQARSPGSWSDLLRVGAAARHELIGHANYHPYPGGGVVELLQAVATPVHPGDLLLLKLKQKRLYLAVTSAEASTWEQRERRPVFRWSLRGTEFWLPPHHASVGARDRASGEAIRVTLSLRVEGERGQIQVLTDLGFCPLHPRYLGYLPADASLFQPAEERPPLPDGGEAVQALWQEVISPRFPLAAKDEEPYYLPTGLEQTYRWNGASPVTGNPLERDGLAAFSLNVFLDPHLKDYPAADLMEKALTQRHIHRRPLRGIHALLPVTDATLISVPDSVHTGWEPVRYETAHGPEQAAVLKTSAAAPAEQPVPPDIAPPVFRPCDALRPPELTATVTTNAGRMLQLNWKGPAAIYMVEMAFEPEFRKPALWYTGPANGVSAWLVTHTTAYFRVRAARDGAVSPWSNPVVIPAPEIAHDTWGTARFAFRLIPEDDRAVSARLRFHRALLTLCLARGDLFAVLSLPYAYHNTRLVDYVHHLTGLSAWLEEPGALSYGALYYPWVKLAEEPGSARLCPPDGPVAGLIAAVTLAGGAWSPPANKLLADATELPSPDHLHTLGRLLEAGINVLVQRPEGGVLVRSAHSLTADPAVRSIGVRRLLGLLRRLILREGSLVVFEPNDEPYRRSLERRFEQLLIDLLVRGAFAGDTPDESFEVVVNPVSSTPGAIEQGQVVIDLRIAPVQPLVYMTLRIVQAPGAEPSIREV